VDIIPEVLKVVHPQGVLKEVPLLKVLNQGVLAVVHPKALKANLPEVKVTVLLPVVKVIALQGVILVAAAGLDKITTVIQVQRSVPLFQYPYRLVGDQIMVEDMVDYPYFHLSLN
jgi:hypothetical protein